MDTEGSPSPFFLCQFLNITQQLRHKFAQNSPSKKRFPIKLAIINLTKNSFNNEL
jgi:hypothetical protein